MKKAAKICIALLLALLALGTIEIYRLSYTTRLRNRIVEASDATKSEYDRFQILLRFLTAVGRLEREKITVSTTTERLDKLKNLKKETGNFFIESVEGSKEIFVYKE